MSIEQRIQELRKSKGLSQEELAAALGVSRQAVSKWESAQSMPDLEKVLLISEYFAVSTDYILKGIQNPPQAVPVAQGKEIAVASKILFVASTAFLLIGLFCAFANWYDEQTAQSIWGSMIIQVVGVVGYYIGKVISDERAPFLIRWLNVSLASFMPISMVITQLMKNIAAPYPQDIFTQMVFAPVYIAVVVGLFLWLRRQSK